MSPTEIVELAAVTAAYNMVARFLVALQVIPKLRGFLQRSFPR